ncbi:uncharacterized protein LOC115889047 [Sitophilus oryzae]|uniref:Uncharacterized protein LOC115889047 n=1 Tax=Sitophilus oryzae TaxID=7048 RepID=A0A6J2YPW8_SITOR|nr:uncharacterized protein LOC115889047 [Sitophilus oryzae]
MKVFVAVSALLLVVLAEEHEHHGDVHGIGHVHKGCQDNPETHVDDEVFKKLLKNEHVDLPDNFGKHVLCMNKGLNIITSDGQVNKEGIKTHIQHVIQDEAKVESILNECSVAKDNLEETALSIDACLRKNHVFKSEHLKSHDHGHHH